MIEEHSQLKQKYSQANDQVDALTSEDIDSYGLLYSKTMLLILHLEWSNSFLINWLF